TARAVEGWPASASADREWQPGDGRPRRSRSDVSADGARGSRCADRFVQRAHGGADAGSVDGVGGGPPDYVASATHKIRQPLDGPGRLHQPGAAADLRPTAGAPPSVTPADRWRPARPAGNDPPGADRDWRARHG